MKGQCSKSRHDHSHDYRSNHIVDVEWSAQPPRVILFPSQKPYFLQYWPIKIDLSLAHCGSALGRTTTLAPATRGTVLVADVLDIPVRY